MRDGLKSWKRKCGVVQCCYLCRFLFFTPKGVGMTDICEDNRKCALCSNESLHSDGRYYAPAYRSHWRTAGCIYIWKPVRAGRVKPGQWETPSLRGKNRMRRNQGRKMKINDLMQSTRNCVSLQTSGRTWGEARDVAITTSAASRSVAAMPVLAF